VLILNNRQETSDELAKHLHASHGSAYGVALLLVIKYRSLTISQRANFKSTEQEGLMPHVKKEVQNSAKSSFVLIWDLQTGIHEHYQERDVIIYGKRFSEMLLDRLRLMIQNKHEAQLKRYCPYTAAHTVETLNSYALRS
jgi:hypothetical protein